MPVPFMANTLADREVLLSQRESVEAFARGRKCDLMLVGVGGVDPSASLVTGGMIEPAEIDELGRLGAKGEVLGHFFTTAGKSVETNFTRRVVTLPLDGLRGKRIVAIAGGASKRDAIRAVLASGLVRELITDERTARAIIDADEKVGGASAKLELRQ
jgi:erythritol transport system ATP-binding protein